LWEVLNNILENVVQREEEDMKIMVYRFKVGVLLNII
jgi:hypothetical protein